MTLKPLPPASRGLDPFLVYLLIGALLKSMAPQSDIFAGPGLAAWRMRRVIAFVDRNMARVIDVPDLALASGLSVAHFSAAFKQRTGMPPHRWVMARRVERAMVFLRDPQRSLVDIALSLGFCDQAHFATTFRRFTGTTATAFRKGIIEPDPAARSRAVRIVPGVLPDVTRRHAPGRLPPRPAATAMRRPGLPPPPNAASCPSGAPPGDQATASSSKFALANQTNAVGDAKALPTGHSPQPRPRSRRAAKENIDTSKSAPGRRASLSAQSRSLAGRREHDQH